MDWRQGRTSVLSIQHSIQALVEQGHQVQLWWAPGHHGIIGNERADIVAKAAMEVSRTTPGEFFVSRTMLQGAIHRWYRAQVRSQEDTAIGTILEPTEETIIYTDLHWTQSMPSRFMAARVGQFLTGHFPTAVYLHRFGHLPSPLCVGCGVLDTREHLLMDCTRWAFHRTRLQEWLQSTCDPPTEEGVFPPIWGWDFLVCTSEGRFWLGRFLVAVRPRWTMHDHFQFEASDGSSHGA